MIDIDDRTGDLNDQRLRSVSMGTIRGASPRKLDPQRRRLARKRFQPVEIDG